MTKTELAQSWERRITSANAVYSKWANRFQVNNLYQYYEGYQWVGDTDISNRPYVVNMIYSAIETKLPNLLFENPLYNIKPRPVGTEFDFQSSAERAQAREDVINYICRRKEFGLNDKHELAALDAFFGFGVIEVDYTKDIADNPYINLVDTKEPLNNLYCKHIPFDQFRVAANANWDLSAGKWWGYFEFIPNRRLTKYDTKLNLDKNSYLDEDSESAQFAMDGKIIVGEQLGELCPANHTKVWHLWDFETQKYCKFAPDAGINSGDSVLDYEDFNYCGISVLRYGKRRKGWYPLPPVFNWISPQDEINDIRQTHKIHRKRYQRKYSVLETSIEEEELDKFLYGPDGQIFKVKRQDAIKPVEDAPLDTANQQSLIVSYDDFLRVSGGASEQGRVADRTTATQASINNQLAKIRDSKDLICVGNFMVQIGNSILKALKEVKSDFWAEFSSAAEPLLGEIKSIQKEWKKISPTVFDEEDYELDVKIDSISPIYQQQDKAAFMEFLAIITQYEVLAFSPALLREAAYRVGYKNQAVLNQFQQLSQLASIGKQVQLQQQVKNLQSPIQTPQGAAPGQLAQQQTDASTPPDLQQISNMIFNKQGVQQPQ